MKNTVAKYFALFVCFLALSSAVQATTISVNPDFSFAYRDIYAPVHTYTIYFSVENSDGVYSGPFLIGYSTTYPANTLHHYTGPTIQVTEPVGPPVPYLCYRFVVLVVRDDGARRTGYGAWCTATDLQNNSQTIKVTPF